MLRLLLMSMMAYGAFAGSAFSYDGADAQSKRRRAPVNKLTSEDDALNTAQRRRLVATTRDLQRNFSIAAWAIRKHLDFVTNFSFASNNAEHVIAEGSEAEQQAKSALDDEIEAIIEEASEPKNCDAAGRHDLSSMVRLGEARATVDGDVLFVRLADGTMQAIEGDRCRSPGGEGRDVKHGVRVDGRGRAIAYAIHTRDGSSFQFERWVPAGNVFHRGYFDRFDQVRGISPMAPALNTLRDLYEGFDLALAKAKIAQLFGLITKRGGLDALGNPTATEINGRTEYSVDLGKGPFHLDLDPGDDAQFLEARTPSTEFQNYSELMIAVSLLSLDLPWNFYKVDATNFFGSRAALNLYLQSVKPKRAANQRLLNQWTRWQLELAILDGRLRLPSGLTIDDLRWSWTPDGLPWWNPSQEADGAIKSIAAGLDNPQRIAQETGTNAFENVDKIAEIQAYARRKGVKLSYAPQPAITIQTGQPSQEGAE